MASKTFSANFRLILPLLVIALLLCAVSLQTLQRELTELREANGGSIERHLGLDGAAHNVRSTVRLPGYVDCLSSVEVFIQVIEFECDEILIESLAQAPLDGDAWFELARLSTVSDPSLQHTVAALERSYRAAPNELWISRRRIRMVYILWDQLPESIHTSANNEIVGIANSWDGLRNLSAMYLDLGADGRQRLISALTVLPQDQQRRFLSAFRQMLRDQ